MSFLNNQEQQQNGAQQQIQFHQRRQMSSTSSNQQEASYQMANPEKLTTSERGKRFAAYECAQAEIRDGLNLGIGSGSTVKYLVDWMHEKNATGGLQHIRCVPTSFQVFVCLGCFGREYFEN
jgi:hypothetical protein